MLVFVSSFEHHFVDVSDVIIKEGKAVLCLKLYTSILYTWFITMHLFKSQTKAVATLWSDEGNLRTFCVYFSLFSTLKF